MSDTPTVFHVRNRLCELILWLLVCLAPWAFGSVEAWAELGLYALIGLLTILVPGACNGSRFPRFLARLPGMALIGLTLLAGFQGATAVARHLELDRADVGCAFGPISCRAVGTVGAHALGPAVPLAAATLSIDPDSQPPDRGAPAGAWLLFLSSADERRSPRPRSRCARVVVFNSVSLALFSIIQTFTWNGRLYWVRPVTAASALSVEDRFCAIAISQRI